ncbi:lactoylglutathione lyase-like lyase [Spirochaeta thermophila DSM 6578]|uniref:Lactoylglutathione lyase-like lyase n=1 Tax=Winmispira thermophila (strain ATCC 700085 / DSM 6578 / Z-1203) TaxID=869211 RepID=G0GBV7_WINT7|nr:VOC family protein [Spirochaeta thermophila]AEJ61968.1 lactoylglutathione lyase-like lyase [Spirochaeta thermophila DSM 6578]
MSIFDTFEIAQVAFIVRDIEKSARAWAALLGVDPPEPVITGPQEEAHTLYRGSPTPARARLAFIPAGQVTVELIEPDEHPSIWREFLDEGGEGLHHLGVYVKDLPQRARRIEALGFPLVQQGDYPGGRYAYMDTRSLLGVMLELLENF